MSGGDYRRQTDFAAPLDAAWETLPGADATFTPVAGAARLVNTGQGKAELYQRCCCLPGDRLTVALNRDAVRRGRLTLSILGGFEYARLSVELTTGEADLRTHEAHQPQPRWRGQMPPGFASLALVRQPCPLPGLPYEGSTMAIVADGTDLGTTPPLDLIPECLTELGLDGPGDVTFSGWRIAGPPRPRPEFLHVGLWQQRAKPTTAANVDGLLAGVRQAAEAGVKLLVTPETSLTGLRIGHPELDNEAAIQAELARFQAGIAAIPGAPFTLVGYPAWVDGRQVEGAGLDRVKVNCHRFVRPDGSLGPPMAKVHSCEEGLWHGRGYNLQRVCGAEVAVGICHDTRYPDVWATGVMGGARLCLHPAAGGNASGPIARLRQHLSSGGLVYDAYWLHNNAGGGSGIVYPMPNAAVRDTLLAVPADLAEDAPGWPDYTCLGDLLARCRIRLYDATGCWPMRTLRNGAAAWHAWSSLIPPLVEV